MINLLQIDDRQSAIDVPRYSFRRVGKLNFDPVMPKGHRDRIKFFLQNNYMSRDFGLFDFQFTFPRRNVSLYSLEFGCQVSNREALRVQNILGHEPAGIGHLLFYGGDKAKNSQDLWVVAPQICVLPNTADEYVFYFGDSGLWGLRGNVPMNEVYLSGRRAIGLRPFEDEWPVGTRFLSVKKTP